MVSTEDVAPKRTSMVNMWKQREQAMLENQNAAPKAVPNFQRRSVSKPAYASKFEEKKDTEPAAPSWKKPTTTPSNVSNNTHNNASTNTSFTVPANRAAAVTTSSSAETANKKKYNKFAMMGQRHAARPKVLTTSYSNPVPEQNPLSPSNESAALSEAFENLDDGGVQELLQHKSTRQRNTMEQSEYSSLQVSDSASIPQELPKDLDDNDSLISGLSSIGGSPRRPYRSNKRQPQPRQQHDQDDSTMFSESYVDPNNKDKSFDESTVLSEYTKSTINPHHRRSKSNIDKASDAIMSDSFAEQNNKDVSAFSQAVSNMTLQEVVNDIREETSSVFKGMGFAARMSEAQELMTQNMVAAQLSINKFMEGNKAQQKDEPKQEVTDQSQEVTDPTPSQPDDQQETAEARTLAATKDMPKFEEEKKDTSLDSLLDTTQDSFMDSKFDETDVWEEFPSMMVPPTPEREKEVTEPQEEPTSQKEALPLPQEPQNALMLPKREPDSIQEEVAIEVEYLEEEEDSDDDGMAEI